MHSFGQGHRFKFAQFQIAQAGLRMSIRVIATEFDLKN
jgi:hypothetical protein